MILSISKIKLFKACRRAYWFRYTEKISPNDKVEALETGIKYHSLLDQLYSGNIDIVEDASKEYAMFTAYKKYIYPKFNVDTSEKWIRKNVSDGIEMVGVVDGIADNGWIVEHKTTSAEITEAYEYDLMLDEQILAYMWITGARSVWYTVCRKPTIRQKKNETEEEFFKRMCEWYDTDTDAKIRLLEIHRTDEEVEQFAKSLKQIAKVIRAEGSHENECYRNTMHCNKWGRRCEYFPICNNYDPSAEYVEFTKE